MRRRSAPADGSEPVEWLLLSTLPVADFAPAVEKLRCTRSHPRAVPVADFHAAVEKLRWYTGRWGSEVYHRVLQSGGKIERRQLGVADRLEAGLAIDLVVAGRIFHLTKLGRVTPDVPGTVYFAEHEWQALVAGRGGFLGRTGDGEPGTQTV